MIAMHRCGAMNRGNVNTGGTDIKCRNKNIFMPNNTWDAIILLTSFKNGFRGKFTRDAIFTEQLERKYLILLKVYTYPGTDF